MRHSDKHKTQKCFRPLFDTKPNTGKKRKKKTLSQQGSEQLTVWPDLEATDKIYYIEVFHATQCCVYSYCSYTALPHALIY